MKNFKFIFLFAIVGIATLFIYSCTKDVNDPNNQDEAQRTQLRTNIVPEVQNGTLKFNTKGDATAFMDELNSILDQGKDGSDNSDEIVISPAVALNVSLKNSLNYTPLYDVSLKNSDGDLIEPLFPILSFNLLMNEFSEILIGDSLFVHKNLRYHYIIHKDDILSRITLRALTSESPVPISASIRVVDPKGGGDFAPSTVCCQKFVNIFVRIPIGNSDANMICRLKNGNNAFGYWHWVDIRCRLKTNDLIKRKAKKIEEKLIVVGRDKSCNILDASTDSDGCSNCNDNQERVYLDSGADFHKSLDGTVDCKFIYKATRVFNGVSHSVEHVIDPDYCN